MSHTRCAAESLRAVFAPDSLEKLARDSRWVKRRRDTQGPAMMTSLMRSLGGGDIRTLAELHRNFNAHSKREVDYKAFYRRLVDPGFALTAHSLLEMAMTNLCVKSVKGLANGPFAQLDDILIHDGTSFALHSDLQDEYPGRFSKISPAAVELHITMSLFTDSITRVTLAPDVECERHYMPAAEDVRNKLLLMDRGYDGRQNLQNIDDAGGFFAVRIRSSQKPRVISVHPAGRMERRHARRMEGQRLDIALHRAAKTSIVDLDVCWEAQNDLVNFARLVCVFNPVAKHWVRIITNLNRESFSAEEILTVYKLRWQVELFNKELKSSANLRRFTVRHPDTAEGLIWCSLCTALVKRFVGIVAQLNSPGGVVISTQRVAKCGSEVLSILCPKTLRNLSVLVHAIASVLAFLCRNARRSNPRRDGLSGRFKLGLEACIGPSEPF